MTAALAIPVAIALLWLLRIAVRGVREWRIERSIRRVERQVQRYCMGPIHGTKERRP